MLVSQVRDKGPQRVGAILHDHLIILGEPLHAWRMWHDTLDICPHVAAFFRSGPGLAFLHQLVMAFHLVCVEVGACGIRLACLFLNLTGLDRFVAASYGA